MGKPIKDRFLGALLGAHAGDALGAAVEGMTSAQVAAKFPQGVRDIVGGGPYGWEPGEPTDDTGLLLCVARSLAARGTLEPEDLSNRYLEWYRKGPKDVGNLWRSVLENLAAGESIDQAGVLAWEDSGRQAASNGSLMCCAPIGLLDVNRPNNVAEDAARLSRLSHVDPRCQGGCAALCTALSLLVNNELDEAVPRAALAGASYADEVRAAIERSSARKLTDLIVDGPDMGYVTKTIEVAFCALQTATDFDEGLVAVVSRGGDADTNGAVAGALLGARWGLLRIPERWQRKLKAKNELLRLGEELWSRATA